MERKGYDSKTLTKKAKAWEKILTRFNSQIPSSISQLQGCWRRLKLQSKKEHDFHRRETKKTGGGKAPSSPSEVSELVADVLPASVNPLEQEFDDDAGEELDLRRDKDEREVITCEVEPRLITHLEAIAKKGTENITLRWLNPQYAKPIHSKLNHLINAKPIHNTLNQLVIRWSNPQEAKPICSTPSHLMSS